jgi:hypothetical protein
MSMYGQSNVTINVDRADGSTVENISTKVLSINGNNITALTEQTDGFGRAWLETLATGMRMMDPVVLELLYDDTALTGSDALFNAVASGPAVVTRTLQVIYGGSKSTSAETLITEYERILMRGKLHKVRVTLQPTGVVTEA